MTPNRFTASLEQSAAQHPPSKARRIAALLPQIEAAMAQGSTRAHIVTALLDLGIAITPHQLSNAMARLRRQGDDAKGLPGTGPTLDLRVGAKAGFSLAGRPAADEAASRVVSVPTLAPSLSVAPNASPASGGSVSRFGAHDPRLLDEVMRSTPDMKALAKLAPKHPR